MMKKIRILSFLVIVLMASSGHSATVRAMGLLVAMGTPFLHNAEYMAHYSAAKKASRVEPASGAQKTDRAHAYCGRHYNQ